MISTGTLHTSSAHKLSVAAALTTAPPTVAGNGVEIPSTWKISGATVRRAVLRLTAAGAGSVTAISVWCYVDSVWLKHPVVIADQTFAAGDLVHGVIVEWPIGTRLAVAYTSAAVNVAVDWYPLETCE